MQKTNGVIMDTACNQEADACAVGGSEGPEAGGQEASEHTRREFIERLRGVAAIPVVAALGLSWTKDAKAYP